MLGFMRGTRVRLLVLVAALLSVFRLPDGQAKPEDCDRNPTGVQTADHYLDFRIPGEPMPGTLFDDREARLRVHTVSPVYAKGKCRGVPNLAAVLIHGRSLPGSANFDLRLAPTATDPDGGRISVQVALARAGIHTFAPDLLGYGLSTRFADGLDDPCNASLPTDRTRSSAVFPLDQQGRYLGDGLQPVADGLGVNPLDGVRCAHTSSTYFANPDVFARNTVQVIDDAIERARPTGNKVVLIGNSFGGPSIARTLYLMGDDADRRVRRVVFLSSLFNRFPGIAADVNLPTDEGDLSETERSTSFPLTLARLGGWTGVGTQERDLVCTGRVIDGAPDALRSQLLALDPLGASWGGSDPDNPTGLLRSPTFSLYGWNPAVAATFNVPTLIMHSTDDTVALVQNSDNMFAALSSVDHKVLVQLGCGSHQAHMEGCSGTRCIDNDPATIPYGQTSQTWAGPHSTVSAALIEWVKYGTFDGAECGRFAVTDSGIASAIATPACG